jgi:hypothetical protein
MLKTVKILFYLSALLFVSKPFLGFSLLDRSQKQEITCELLVKLFSKRKNDFIEPNLFESPAVLHQGFDPLFKPLLFILGTVITGFLSFLYGTGLTKAAIKRIQLRLPGSEDTYLYSMSFRI